MDGAQATMSAVETKMRELLAGTEFTADEITGDVAFEANGKPYTLRFSTAAMRKVEAAFEGKSFFVVVQEMGDGQRVTDLVRVLAMGLSDNHKISMDEADLIVDAVGFLGVTALVTKAVELAAVKVKRKAGGRPLASS